MGVHVVLREMQESRPDPKIPRWINPLIERRGFNKAVVALANKNARIAWNIVANDAHYDPGKAFGSA